MDKQALNNLYGKNAYTDTDSVATPKGTMTISACMPKHLVVKLDELSEDMNVSRSAVITAIVSLALKWELIK